MLTIFSNNLKVKKVYSFVILNKRFSFVIKRFYPGNSLAQTLFKGVSGSFTMHEKLFKELLGKKGVLAYHLLHYISNLPKTKLNSVQELYNNVSNIVLSKDNLCKNPKIREFGKILNYEPFSLVFPWNQNFLSHKTYKQRFSIENLEFSHKNKLPIDATAFLETGMTVQNFLEYNLIQNVFEGLYATYIQENKKDNIKFTLINPLLQQGKSFTYNVSKIQPNPDAIAQMFIVKNGIEQPPKDIIQQQKNTYLDVKIIQSPENNLSPLLGNISITSSIDFLIYLDRLVGALSNLKNANNIFIKTIIGDLQDFKKCVKKEISSEINKIEKELKKLEIKYNIKEITANVTEEILKKNVNKFYEILYKIHCNPQIKDIFPSIIYFNTYNETNNLSQHNDQLFSFLNQVVENKDPLIKYSTLPQHYFIPMGQENDEIYRNNVYKFISVMQKSPLQTSLTENFELFMDSLKNLTNNSLSWKN